MWDIRFENWVEKNAERLSFRFPISNEQSEIAFRSSNIGDIRQLIIAIWLSRTQKKHKNDNRVCKTFKTLVNKALIVSLSKSKNTFIVQNRFCTRT